MPWHPLHCLGKQNQPWGSLVGRAPLLERGRVRMLGGRSRTVAGVAVPQEQLQQRFSPQAPRVPPPR
uniref:Uncharacterized protein n=1 Tax=Cyanistes caeruleus TaxID=156563 RepID=A0A8C0VUG8_CYACU